MFIFYVIDLKANAECKERDSKKSKIQTIGNRAKKFVPIISFQKFLIFQYGLFEKMLNVSKRH